MNRFPKLKKNKSKKGNSKVKADNNVLLNLYFAINMNYPNYFLGKSNPVKELLESIGSIYTVLEYIKKNYSKPDTIIKNKNVLCVIPGDGNVPRTGLMLSYLTNWTILSVDPEMANKCDSIKDGTDETHIKNSIEQKYNVKLPEKLHCIRDKAETINFMMNLHWNVLF